MFFLSKFPFPAAGGLLWGRGGSGRIREFFVELFTKSCVLLGWQGFVFLI